MAKVIVGLSGGVDSAVAAYLLKKQGHEVIGAFMRNWDSQLNNDILGNNWKGDICPQEVDYNDAKEVARLLGIELLRVDFIKEYWDHVFTYFLDEYKKGRTPNPDIMCNKYIKFDSFLKFAKDHGADYVATGHYAKIVHEENRSILMKASDDNKDQSYFLSFLSQEQIKDVLFPLADIDKSEVRRIASELNLNVANKKDSTGICFIGERNFKNFLMNYLPAQPGKMVTVDGKVIGNHDGLMYYTIGQRKGLGIGGSNEYKSEAWFVCGKDLEKNELIVGQGHDSIYLESNWCTATDANWISYKPVEGKEYTAKFRYRQKDIAVTIEYKENNEIIVKYPSCCRAVTPGQAVVVYEGEICLGGAIIDKVYYNDERRKY